MEPYRSYIEWLDQQKEAMLSLVVEWANINTHAFHKQGLQQGMHALKKAFSSLNGRIQELHLPSFNVSGNEKKTPLGKALHITKRLDKKPTIFLAGHMDTVFAKNSSFKKVEILNEERATGPGVADMKGGLVTLLFTLKAFERSPYAEKIGWEVLINPDEEIGSPGSKAIFERASKRNMLGLLFEPAMEDGSLVQNRAGSINYQIEVTGKAAHSGRNFYEGTSALYALIDIINEIRSLISEDTIVNTGKIESGNSFNIIPDSALAKINIRSKTNNSFLHAKNRVIEIVEKYNQMDGISASLIEHSKRPPKEASKQTKQLISWINQVNTLLGNPECNFKETYGVCDGNFLEDNGLPTIDTLGPIGGKLHTHGEYLEIDSLVQRSKVALLLLMKIANNEYIFQ